jgi:hypothetical protein
MQSNIAKMVIMTKGITPNKRYTAIETANVVLIAMSPKDTTKLSVSAVRRIRKKRLIGFNVLKALKSFIPRLIIDKNNTAADNT